VVINTVAYLAPKSESSVSSPNLTQNSYRTHFFLHLIPQSCSHKFSQHQLSANPPTPYPEAKSLRWAWKSILCVAREKSENSSHLSNDTSCSSRCNFDSGMLSAYKFRVAENIYDHYLIIILWLIIIYFRGVQDSNSILIPRIHSPGIPTWGQFMAKRWFVLNLEIFHSAIFTPIQSELHNHFTQSQGLMVPSETVESSPFGDYFGDNHQSVSATM
jgi:hypothetical protein